MSMEDTRSLRVTLTQRLKRLACVSDPEGDSLHDWEIWLLVAHHGPFSKFLVKEFQLERRAAVLGGQQLYAGPVITAATGLFTPCPGLIFMEGKDDDGYGAVTEDRNAMKALCDALERFKDPTYQPILLIFCVSTSRTNNSLATITLQEIQDRPFLRLFLKAYTVYIPAGVMAVEDEFTSIIYELDYDTHPRCAVKMSIKDYLGPLVLRWQEDLAGQCISFSIGHSPVAFVQFVLEALNLVAITLKPYLLWPAELTEVPTLQAIPRPRIESDLGESFYRLKDFFSQLAFASYPTLGSVMGGISQHGLSFPVLPVLSALCIDQLSRWEQQMKLPIELQRNDRRSTLADAYAAQLNSLRKRFETDIEAKFGKEKLGRDKPTTVLTKKSKKRGHDAMSASNDAVEEDENKKRRLSRGLTETALVARTDEVLRLTDDTLSAYRHGLL